MGYYLSIVAAVLDRTRNKFVERNEVLQFGNPAFVSWSQPVAEAIPHGWRSLAEGTLHAKYRSEDIAEDFEYITYPVHSQHGSDLFDYAQNFVLGSNSVLFHLVLPPLCLPLGETIKPFPTYARLVRKRFLLGWSQESHEWFRFTLKKVVPRTFNEKAIELERRVINGQIDELGATEESDSLERQLRTLRGNRWYLEEQAARHGTVQPLWLHNELEDSKKQIDALEARLSRLLK